MQNLTNMEQQHLMSSIEEHTERLNFLQQAAKVEEKQKNRIIEMNRHKELEREKQKIHNLLDGKTFDDKEEHQKILLEKVNKSVAPGTIFIQQLFVFLKIIIFVFFSILP